MKERKNMVNQRIDRGSVFKKQKMATLIMGACIVVVIILQILHDGIGSLPDVLSGNLK